MKRFFILLSIVWIAIAGMAQWLPDSTLYNYSYRTVKQANDYQGTVVSTIIKRDTTLAGCHRGILYIHGFNDYFFQSALGDSITRHGWDFRAVDLRRYGRSLRPGQKRYQVRNINEYYPDIDSALVDMTKAGIDTIVLLGHSTGGLIASCYMNHHPMPQVKGLILNSPFLEWNMGGFTRKFLIPVVDCVAGLFPNIKINQGSDTGYSHSLLKEYNGEWQYDTSKKLIVSPPVTSGWVRAINEAQKSLHKHSDITVPILLMHSSKSVSGSEASEGDAVLNVRDISKYGRRLGPNVTEITVNGGLHDLILSKPQVRQAVYAAMFAWLSRNFDKRY